jgi:amino acid transporter
MGFILQGDEFMTEKVAITQMERRKLKRELTLLPLFGLIYFTVCGGSFGAEPMISLSGPGFALVLLFLTPLVFSIPNMLMVRELQSMMPVEGGYYHWLKKAFGPFVGFMGGWMNWVVSWVDVSIYPVLAAVYLSCFFCGVNKCRDVVDLVGKLPQCPRGTLDWFDNRLARGGHDDPVDHYVSHWNCSLDQEWTDRSSAIPSKWGTCKFHKPDPSAGYWYLRSNVELYGLGATYGCR